jgi:uncharacterized protein YndB with AHSA1/START domain
MTFDAGPLADASVVPDGDAWTLIFVKELRHPPVAVWTALTDPAELDQWAPFAAERDLGTTGETTLTMIDGDTRMALPATVRRAEPPALLEYVWGDDVLRWELTPTAGGTRLTLRHTITKLENGARNAAGWHLCLAVLARLLDGDPVGVIRGQASMGYGWERLRDGYADMFKRDGA